MRGLAKKAVAVLAVGAMAAGLTAADGKHADIETVMKKVNGKKGLCAACVGASKADKWEDAQKAGKELKQLGEDLGKNPCPKGDEASWKKLTKQYAEQTAAIAEAADKKDAKALATAAGTFQKSCKTCHDAHK